MSTYFIRTIGLLALMLGVFVVPALAAPLAPTQSGQVYLPLLTDGDTANADGTITGVVEWRYTRNADGADGAYERYEAEATITFRLRLVDPEQGFYADAGSTYSYSAAMDKLVANSGGTKIRYRWTEQGNGPAENAFAYLREARLPTEGRQLQASSTGLPYTRTGTTTVITFPGAPPISAPINDSGAATIGCDGTALVDAVEAPDSVGQFNVACSVFGTSVTGQLHVTE